MEVDSSLRNKPALRSALVALDNADLGKTFTFMLKVSSIKGEIDGPSKGILFATVPGKPSAGPVEDTT